jgi:hypothetical protein
MADRQPIPDQMQRDLLLACRRRCSICYGLHGDLDVKKGQIAHLDRKRSNNVLENLVWLCVEHHPEYDGRFNQVKNFTIEEVRAFRSELYIRLSAPSPSVDLDRIAHVMRMPRSDAREMQKQLSRKDLPHWIRDSASALGRLVEESPDGIRRAAESKSYLVSIVGYTNIEDNLKRVQLELAQYIDRLGFGDQQRFVEEQFRISIAPAIACSSRTLYVFPYFHVPSRRRHWGVLPFAHQTSIGFIVHQSHPAAEEWDSIVGHSRTGGLTSVGVLVSAEEWCERLILHTDARDGMIHSVDGFIFYEILSEALARRGPESLGAFARRHTNIRPEEQAFLFCMKGCSTKEETSVFVFDPGESDLVKSLLAPEFRMIVTPHQVDVPVGVGFSLPCLPRLLAGGRWELILREAERVYAPYDEALEKLGIRLLASVS